MVAAMRIKSTLLLAFLAAAAVAVPTSAVAAAPAPMAAARQVLTLTKSRLGLMDQVMASKWLSRAPIQDPVQEATVTETAVAEAEPLGVSAELTRSVFAAEIAAAKEVQLGWGSHWLYYGAPEGLAAPELATLRAELTAISKGIVAELPRLDGLATQPNVRARLLDAAKKILRVRYLTAAGREAIVDALLLGPAKAARAASSLEAFGSCAAKKPFKRAGHCSFDHEHTRGTIVFRSHVGKRSLKVCQRIIGLSFHGRQCVKGKKPTAYEAIPFDLNGASHDFKLVVDVYSKRPGSSDPYAKVARVRLAFDS
jgi:chorismate mutase